MTSNVEIYSGGISKLTMTEFDQLASLVYEQCGIKMPSSKKVMLESRLNRRLRALKVSTFKEYIQYVLSKEGMSNELVYMINEVTTNKTDFFREPHHFDFMKEHVLPEFVANGPKRPFRIWSAACSSGEEPYTLAMTLNDFTLLNRGFDYSILASDISTGILQKAIAAIYSMDRVAAIPAAVKQKYFLKSRDQLKPTVRVIPELRAKVKFQQVNLMDNTLDVEPGLDVIFCRNVLIYFDRATQQEVLRKLCDKLKRGGYLFIGHSESLFQLDLPLRQSKPTVFQRL